MESRAIKPGKKLWRRLLPWLLLATGLAIFYDLNPLYPLLRPLGVNLHLPLPAVVDDSWKQSTKPLISSTEQEKLVSDPPIEVVNSGRGPIKMQTFLAPGSDLGVACVGGIGGGFDSPAQNVYNRLGMTLKKEGISSVHLCLRKRAPFDETVHDMRAAVEFLLSKGNSRVIVVGHSLGAATSIAAASLEPKVIAAAALSSQPYGANPVQAFGDRRLLVISGVFDVVEPPAWSNAIYKAADCKKDIAFFLGSHPLDECGDPVYERLLSFVRQCDGETRDAKKLPAAQAE